MNDIRDIIGFKEHIIWCSLTINHNEYPIHAANSCNIYIYEYPNIHLNFMGHLDSDMIKDVDTPTDPTTDKLADSFMKLGSQCTIVKVSSDKEPELPMDTLKPGQSDNGGIKTTDDINKSMTNDAIDALHLDFRGKKDRLSIEDIYKYSGVEKFNPKSFQSGSSVGFIDLNAATKEVLFSQIRMLRELMFDVIPLS